MVRDNCVSGQSSPTKHRPTATTRPHNYPIRVEGSDIADFPRDPDIVVARSHGVTIEHPHRCLRTRLVPSPVRAVDVTT